MTLILLLVGCKVQQSTHSEQSDSVRIEVREVKTVEYRDTTVYLQIPVESKAVVREDSSFLETSVAFLSARLDTAGMLWHTLENKPAQQAQIIKVPVYEYRTDSIYVQQAKEIKEVPVKMPLTWWENFFVTIGKIATGVVIMALVVLFVKFLSRV